MSPGSAFGISCSFWNLATTFWVSGDEVSTLSHICVSTGPGDSTVRFTGESLSSRFSEEKKLRMPAFVPQ